ncbi:hypothetical protein OIV83_000202 [Microbotryomycetes sp. JL201]|nr:hypothetical protein OIV83_000202 [Microbotryomycetes sp. JL201]
MGGHSSEPFEPQPAETSKAKQARLPLGHENLYATWKCDDFRHAYEKCEYDECVALLAPQGLPATATDVLPFCAALCNSTKYSYISRMKALDKLERQRREEEA